MNNLATNLVGTLVLATIILMVLYSCGCLDKKQHFTNPQLTENNNKIFTYIEKEYSGTDRVCLPYNNVSRDIPVFYKYCANLMQKHGAIVVTPENINNYLTEEEIPFTNGYSSQLTFKNRSDLIGSALLYKYGGLFLERGTILMKDPKVILHKLELYDMVTFGLARNPPGLTCCSVENMPNNQVLASRPQNPALKLYSSYLFEYCKSGVIAGGNFDSAGSNALSKALIDIKKANPNRPNTPNRPFNDFNFGAEYDGTRDKRHGYIDFKLLLGFEDINFVSPESLLFISTPTNELSNITEFSWFLNLSEKQFNDSDIYVVRVLHEKLKLI